MKKIRNDGYAHPSKPQDLKFVVRVDYAARTYEFPAGQVTEVADDVADYVSSIYAGQGLVIVHEVASSSPANLAPRVESPGTILMDSLRTKLVAARAKLPTVPTAQTAPAGPLAAKLAAARSKIPAAKPPAKPPVKKVASSKATKR